MKEKTCEHLIQYWKIKVLGKVGFDVCGRKAKFITHHPEKERFACGIHAKAYDRLTKYNGLPKATKI